MKPAVLVTSIFLCLGVAPNIFAETDSLNQSSASTIHVPLGGNTWVQGSTGRQRLLTNNGIENWSDAAVSFDAYVRVNKPGDLVVAVKAKTDGESKLQLQAAGKKYPFVVKGNELQLYPAGTFHIKDTGYIKLTLSGISKTGQQFAAVAEYEISGSAINDKTVYVKSSEGNFFYWGRRGPSVHLNYPVPEGLQTEWYYNEVTVPEGQDVNGSYYMANGFGEGYFGMQVNSPTERRILFSVWSPFSTDDPKSIPEDMRITMLKKGADVHTGEFGNEGAGGQSYLRYYWKAGNTYKFLLNGHPDGNGSTIYTAYFFAPEKNEWMLIASFKRPKTNTYLKRFHSFLENFNPDQGDKQRHVLFGNQWVCDAKGNWTELTKAGFTYDNTAAKGYRMDYAGGLKKGQFFLQNCGFFNHYTLYRTSFERPATGKKPEIELSKLP